MKIAAFPKCYIEDIAIKRTMSVFDWIAMAKDLPCEGLELYEGFLWQRDDDYLDAVGEALEASGFAMPMLCCSPDFTNPDLAARERAFEQEAEMIRITAKLGRPGATCRVLSGQRYPEVGREEGVGWVVDAIKRLLPIARDNDVVLGMENHYKDGAWRYPEFAQKQDVFLEIVNAIEDPHFGVQYDPSNAIVAGEDPLALLDRVKQRVVSMHASDRFLAPGASLEALRQSDGTLGYSPDLRHGVTGKGLNDYPAIFKALKSVGYARWISIEDGMNGMDEMRQSLEFLHRMREQFA
jgi:sugar phosphate isomerase/epimerase